MKNFDFDQEWKFIDYKKRALDKKSLGFELLAVAQVLLFNYDNAETKKMRNFYKIVYLKTKKFYLCRAKTVKA